MQNDERKTLILGPSLLSNPQDQPRPIYFLATQINVWMQNAIKHKNFGLSDFSTCAREKSSSPKSLGNKKIWIKSDVGRIGLTKNSKLLSVCAETSANRNISCSWQWEKVERFFNKIAMTDESNLLPNIINGKFKTSVSIRFFNKKFPRVYRVIFCSMKSPSISETKREFRYSSGCWHIFEFCWKLTGSPWPHDKTIFRAFKPCSLFVFFASSHFVLLCAGNVVSTHIRGD